VESPFLQLRERERRRRRRRRKHLLAATNAWFFASLQVRKNCDRKWKRRSIIPYYNCSELTGAHLPKGPTLAHPCH
jgi:hypothetical protein